MKACGVKKHSSFRFLLFFALVSLEVATATGPITDTTEEQEDVDQLLRGPNDDKGTEIHSHGVLAGLGDSCGSGLACEIGFSCEPGIQQCFHNPRLENQPCSSGYGCADGLECAYMEGDVLTCTSMANPDDLDNQARAAGYQADYEEAYIGCFADTPNRALPVYKGYGNSVEKCEELCIGYKFFGRQAMGECWCGDDEYDKHGKATGCDCHGRNAGDWKQCVYRANYLGCFADTPNRALPVYKGYGNSVDKCDELCIGYKFFGRQAMGECWCGDGEYDKHGEAVGCDCDGKNAGDWKQCVYKSIGTVPENYLGCFADTPNRALPVYKGYGNSVEKCEELCIGYKFFGRQAMGECWCGNGEYDKHGEAVGCDCDGKNAGDWKQCVYRANYLGCFADTPNRALPVYKGYGNSVDKCEELCIGYKFFGRQAMGECWCGDGEYDKHGKAVGCDCDGKNAGDWKQCVYKNIGS